MEQLKTKHKLKAGKDSKVKERIIVAVEGLEKRGKTDLSLSAPKPLVIVNLDKGIEHLLAGRYKAHRSGILEKVIEKPANMKEAAKAWDELKGTIFDAFDCPGVKSVILDTESDSWDLIQFARLKPMEEVKKSGKKEHHTYRYAPVNAEFRMLIHTARETDKNFILTRKLRPLWVGDTRTNRFEPVGHKSTVFDVDVNVRVNRDSKPAKGGGKDVFYGFEITDCGINGDVIGDEYWGEDCDLGVLLEELVG